MGILDVYRGEGGWQGVGLAFRAEKWRCEDEKAERREYKPSQEKIL